MYTYVQHICAHHKYITRVPFASTCRHAAAQDVGENSMERLSCFFDDLTWERCCDRSLGPDGDVTCWSHDCIYVYMVMAYNVYITQADLSVGFLTVLDTGPWKRCRCVHGCRGASMLVKMRLESSHVQKTVVKVQSKQNSCKTGYTNQYKMPLPSLMGPLEPWLPWLPSGSLLGVSLELLGSLWGASWEPLGSFLGVQKTLFGVSCWGHIYTCIQRERETYRIACIT